MIKPEAVYNVLDSFQVSPTTTSGPEANSKESAFVPADRIEYNISPCDGISSRGNSKRHEDAVDYLD